MMSIKLFSLLLWAAVNAQSASEGTLDACAADKHGSVSYVVCRFDQNDDIRLFLNDAGGEPYGHFNWVNDALKEKGERLVFAMNAGMYHEDRSPVGFYRENGEDIAPVNTNDGPGNFHLKPNGIFYVLENGQAGVDETSVYVRTKRAPPRYATQSGPMLLIDGVLHPRFLPESDSRKRRNGVGVTDSGDAIFVLADTPVNLYDFASYFREVLGVRNALYLDGTISRLYAPALDRNDPGVAMGPIIGVVEKRQ